LKESPDDDLFMCKPKLLLWVACIAEKLWQTETNILVRTHSNITNQTLHTLNVCWDAAPQTFMKLFRWPSLRMLETPCCLATFWRISRRLSEGSERKHQQVQWTERFSHWFTTLFQCVTVTEHTVFRRDQHD
jgi:hypothetical protein